jgi:hypothetical protein
MEPKSGELARNYWWICHIWWGREEIEDLKN